MTPEQEALREKVARNIERAVQMQDFGHWGDDGGFICTVEQAKRLAACCDDAAADAIAVVLKEAARALEGDFDSEIESYASHFRKSILSLIPQEEGK